MPSDRLVVERLEFEGFCGITESERTVPQPMAVDLELVVETSSAVTSDALRDTVDYAEVTEEIIAIAQQQQFTLLETFAERLAQNILARQRVQELHLWLRKLRPQVKGIRGSVGVKISRRQEDRALGT
jgi:dihydroneopterin aldolase